MDRERHGEADRAGFPEGSEGWGDPLRVSPMELAALFGRDTRGDGMRPQPVGRERWAGCGCARTGALQAPEVSSVALLVWRHPQSARVWGSPGDQQRPGGGNRLVLVGDTWSGPFPKGPVCCCHPVPTTAPCPPVTPRLMNKLQPNAVRKINRSAQNWHQVGAGSPACNRLRPGPAAATCSSVTPLPPTPSSRTSPTSSRPWPVTA